MYRLRPDGTLGCVTNRCGDMDGVTSTTVTTTAAAIVFRKIACHMRMLVADVVRSPVIIPRFHLPLPFGRRI